MKKLTYEMFEMCIKSIIEQDEYIGMLYDITEGGLNLWDNDKLTTSNTMLNLLKELTSDKDDWIGYWLYECEHGGRNFCDEIKDKEENKIPFRTIKDLWNVLVNNKEEK